ncbi:c-type cytochrome [uncultured Herbaspirillum sp.]|uniref:c-type cytochrome n=1 Tax=uncultured Herbaspirillum sp. TaxID=160236 RepID=UPI002582A9D6|nr:c-type cytochrome [uncultured Herbaspirillum sp.]
MGLYACISLGAASRAVLLPGGDALHGRRLLAERGCAACHRIASVAPSGSRTGPPLEHLERNSYIAGILPMNADNLARWIMHPRAIHPHSAMPELGISAQEAADMSAYLRSVDQSSTP